MPASTRFSRTGGDWLGKNLMLHDPGGTRTALPAGVKATAVYGGANNKYRYRLDWTWDESLPVLMALMMNPSCASEQCGDRTVSWVFRWAKARGYGKLIVVNSMAYRAADQARLAEVDDPYGPENRHHIFMAAKEASTIVCGYGKPKIKNFQKIGLLTAKMLSSIYVLYAWRIGKNKFGQHHPGRHLRAHHLKHDQRQYHGGCRERLHHNR